MRKFFHFAFFVFSSVLLVCSCNQIDTNSKGYDGRVYDISVNHDKSLTVTSTLNKTTNQYDLVVNGEGESVSYSSKESVPWNPIVKRVGSLTINSGILTIGDYLFNSLTLDYVFLPMSTYQVEQNSFNPSTILYSYGAKLSSNLPNKVYYYAETKPEEPGNYFYLVDGEPRIYVYVVPSFLFIGNSFTWRQGSEADPSVPKHFKKIAADLGYQTTIDSVCKSSHTLTAFANPNDEMGRIVESKLTNNSYDYVILQEQSTAPLNKYNDFQTAVQTLKTRIRQTQGNDCKIILYETWGSPAGLSGTTYQTTSEMEQALRNAYDRCAQATGLTVNYVGKAFAYAYETLQINIYADDDRHQSELGAYYSAAVHVRSIFNINVKNCKYYYSEETAEQNKCKTLLQATDTII